MALNTHAFEYDSLLDGQQKKEFWGHIIALTVIVTATVIFLPAGAVLAGAYGVMEVTSAVEGKDWISNRDLNAGERWFRGILSIADIVPAVASVSKFKTLGNTGWLKQLGIKTVDTTKQMKHSMQDVVSTARLEGVSRLRNAKTYAIERARQTILKTEESTLKSMKKADELGTNAKNNLNIFASREELSLAGIGNMRNVADNSHKLENATKGMYSKIKGSGGSASFSTQKIREVEFGKHIKKGVFGRKELKANIQYVTEDGYKYTTDEFGRIVMVEADDLILKQGKRNVGMQKVAGRKDRLADDDGGHLIGTQFNGPGDIDNLVAQNRQINRAGGEWYYMERRWADALKEVPPKKVSVKIEPVYSKSSLRPDSFKVKYKVEGKRTVITSIENQAGG